MDICGGKTQTNSGGVRMMETQRPNGPQGCPLGVCSSRNKEKETYTDVPNIRGKQLADVPVSEESVVLGVLGLQEERLGRARGQWTVVERNELPPAAHRR